MVVLGLWRTAILAFLRSKVLPLSRGILILAIHINIIKASPHELGVPANVCILLGG